MKMNILIVDDHRILRQGLAAILETYGHQVVGQASDGEEAFAMARELKPDIILMDLEMPNMDGVVATQLIKQHMPEIKILILSAFSENERVLEAMKAGASGYVLKRTSPEDLMKIIQATVDGEIFISPFLANLVLSECFNAHGEEGSEENVHSNPLSPRERAVLSLIVNGRSNEEIAATMHVKKDTVKAHLKHIFEKIHVENRTQAAVAALEQKLIHS